MPEQEMKIYFAGSISGGREDAALYAQLIEFLKGFGEVLTEHVGALESNSFFDEHSTDNYIHDRDVDWLLSASLVVAEVSVVSVGVGYEIGRAVAAGIPVVCLYREGSARRLSAMVGGCGAVKVLRYNTLAELYAELQLLLDNYLPASGKKQIIDHGRGPDRN